MNPIYAPPPLRRHRQVSVLGAALFGVTWLALILFTLFYNGLAGLNWQVFTKIPRAGIDRRRVLNAIVGSIIMTGSASHRRAARPVRRHVSGGVRQERPLTSVTVSINEFC